MGKDREPRERIDQTEIDLLKPLDILVLGSEQDPCFGKAHDLKAKECMECGDSEFCALVKAQGLTKERIKIEAAQRFKDLEHADKETLEKKEKAKVYIEECRSRGVPRLKTILKTTREFNLPKHIVKQIYDQI